jgi:hypothetical protein
MQAKITCVYHMLSNSEGPLIRGRHLGLNCANFVLDLFLFYYQVAPENIKQSPIRIAT